MLRQIEVLGLRALRYANVEVGAFQVLVGPNASGKSTLLDALLLVRDVLLAGLQKALQGDVRSDIAPRAVDPHDLSWLRRGDPLELALTFDVPEPLRADPRFSKARYEVGLDTNGPLAFTAETLWLCRNGSAAAKPTQRSLFPHAASSPPHIVKLPGQQAPEGWRQVVRKNPGSGNDNFLAENGKWNTSFRIGPERSALANLPADEDRFPAALWVRQLLTEGVHRIQLNAEKMRLPSPAGAPPSFLPDGSNLPWVVRDLPPDNMNRWLEHVRTALPDVEAIASREREADRARYLEVTYQTGLKAPSWVLSDGTLRLLALTLLAYAAPTARILLIEEPENGVHPRALETVLQSLQSVYDGQVFLATHSPLVLSQVKDTDLLCFGKDPDGAVDIVRGNDHPALRSWRDALNLGDLFASGVLG